MEKNADGEKRGIAKASAEHSRLPKKVHWTEGRLFRFIADRGSDFHLSRKRGKFEPLPKESALAMLDGQEWLLTYIASYQVKSHRPEFGRHYEFQLARAADLSEQCRGYFTVPFVWDAKKDYLAGERARKAAVVAGLSKG